MKRVDKSHSGLLVLSVVKPAIDRAVGRVERESKSKDGTVNNCFDVKKYSKIEVECDLAVGLNQVFLKSVL